jgi:hypothetical protein
MAVASTELNGADKHEVRPLHVSVVSQKPFHRTVQR